MFRVELNNFIDELIIKLYLIILFLIQILPLENEMKTPKAFGGSFGVLNKAMVLIVALYVGMGFFGYLNYGDEIEGSITLNLPRTEM